MAHQFRHLILAATCALVAVDTARAQANRPPESKQHFTVFAPEVPGGISYRTAAKPVPQYSPALVFFPSARSPVYEYAGPAPLQFVDAGTKEVVASVDLPLLTEEALLVFFPVTPPPGSTVRYQVYVHDDARTKHGAGGLAVLNFSGLSLSGTIDRKKIELKEGYQGPFNVGTSAKVQLSTTFHERKLQSYADTIALGSDGRALLILLPPFRQGSIEVQSRVLLDEVVSEKKDEKPKR